MLAASRKPSRMEVSSHSCHNRCEGFDDRGEQGEQNIMSLSAALLPEFDREMANTRRTLERVPDDKFGWKPHEKSGTMGWLAGHLAMLPHWMTMVLSQDEFDLNPPGRTPPQPPQIRNTSELLDTFDRNVSAARANIASAENAHLMENWSLLSGGRVIFTLPRTAVLRSFVLNHMVHHRGQLTVYLRLNNLPVPALYGPSADERSP